MAFIKLGFAAALSLTTVLVQACGSVTAGELTPELNAEPADFEALQKSPDLARKFDYCNWAFELGGKTQDLPDYDALLDRETTTLSPKAWRATALVEGGTQIARNAKSEKACRSAFKKGTKSFDKQMQKSLAKHKSMAKYDKSDDPAIASVQADLANYWIEDQAARRVYIASRTDDKTGAEFWTRRLAANQTALADSGSTAFMKNVLNEYDWIDQKRFGERVSMGAWLLVQHADDHVELQRLALTRMEPYLKTGGVSAKDYAYLWDRVAVNSGEKQRYGTQPTWECSDAGQLTLQPMEDPERVNERRAEMGMSTVEQSLAEMSREVCG